MDLTVLGLTLNIIGGVLMAIFGLPPDVKKGGVVYLMLDQSDKADAQKYNVYTFLQYVGILILILGFILQLIDIAGGN